MNLANCFLRSRGKSAESRLTFVTNVVLSESVEADWIGRTLYCNLTGFGIEKINPCISLNEKSVALFSNGIEASKPGFWRVLVDNNNVATLEITHPVPPEYLLFFDIWETSLLWKGEIDLNKNSNNSRLSLTNGKVLTNKKRFGIFPYVDTLATFDAIIYNKDEIAPKTILPNFNKQLWLAPEDFDSPYDMKRYPQYFDPDFIEYFFAVEEALAKGEEPPARPKLVFVPDSNTNEQLIEDKNDGNSKVSSKGFKSSAGNKK